MIYEIYNNDLFFKLDVADSLKKGSFPSLKKINKRINHNIELCYKLEGIYEFLKYEEIRSYAEPMAGAGFSCSLVKQWYNPTMYLNDYSEFLYNHLSKAFPEDVVTNFDIDKGNWGDKHLPKKMDCIFADYSHFTFNHSTLSLEGFLKKTRKVFIYTDVFPFSLKPYDKDKLIKYLQRVKKFFFKRKWYVHSIFLYPNKKVMMLKIKKTANRSFRATVWLDKTENIITIEKLGGLGV